MRMGMGSTRLPLQRSGREGFTVQIYSHPTVCANEEHRDQGDGDAKTQ